MVFGFRFHQHIGHCGMIFKIPMILFVLIKLSVTHCTLKNGLLVGEHRQIIVV
jgi:hypothetical protein